MRVDQVNRMSPDQADESDDILEPLWIRPDADRHLNVRCTRRQRERIGDNCCLVAGSDLHVGKADGVRLRSGNLEL